MLAQLEAHVAEQQRFAANASHELRTPLAISQTLLDVARNDPRRDHDELVDRLHAVNARAIDLTEALLLLSRADQRSFTRERVDLSLLAEEAIESLLPARRGARCHHCDVRRRHPDHRLACAASAADDEPRPQRDRPQPARAGHRLGDDLCPPRRAWRSPSRTPASSSASSWSRRSPNPSSAAPNASPWPCRCRPRPGDRQEHHPGARRNAHPRRPGGRGTPRHGGPTGRASARGRLTIEWPLISSGPERPAAACEGAGSARS